MPHQSCGHVGGKSSDVLILLHDDKVKLYWATNFSNMI